MPELSVVMPVYNTGSILKYSIAKILEQSYSDFELILVDDGSTDGSGLVCDTFAEQDNRVSVIHKVNGGAGSARNAGIEKATGRYIIFPDADDFCKPEMFQTMMDAIHRDDYDLVICSYENVKVEKDGSCSDIQAQKLFDSVADTPEAARELWFKLRKINISLLNTPWNKIYKKSIIDQYHIRFPDIKRAQDAVFNLYYYDRISSVKVIGKSLYQYNANDTVKTGKKFPKDVYECFLQLDKTMVDIISKWGMYYGEYKTLCDNHLMGIIDECVNLCTNPVWNLSTKEKYIYLHDFCANDYLQGKLETYEGNVYEIEDLISPVKKCNPKQILFVLKKRRIVESFKNSFLGNCLRKVYHFDRLLFK
jgi:glycosyltransferase involved in cell wall biosynthesis